MRVGYPVLLVRWACQRRTSAGLILLIGRSPNQGRTCSRRRLSVTAKVVGLRSGSAAHTSHHCCAHQLNRRGSTGPAG